MKIIDVRFYVMDSGREPVRDWLKRLDRCDCKIIGEDIKTVEVGWPLGMPLVRKLEAGLWEVRCNISSGRIARVVFTVVGGKMVLLHGFVKKTQKTPASDLELAKTRRNDLLKK